MNKQAKALYDNRAECADELAFRKGDILTVINQNVGGTSGWWMCSLYGRHGLAPANRLRLLPETESTAGFSTQVVEKAKPAANAKAQESVQNIYQIPNVLQPVSNPTYERMDMIYKIPSNPLSSARSPNPSALTKPSTEGLWSNKPSFNIVSGPEGGVYDVPNQIRKGSLLPYSTTPRQISRKYSLISVSELEKRFNCQASGRCSSPADCYVYEVPSPSPPRDQNYDIPVPSTAVQEKVIGEYSSLPTPRRPEGIYDVPVTPEKQTSLQDSCAAKAVCGQIYNTLPVHAFSIQRDRSASFFYDRPKPNSPDIPSPPKVLPRQQVYNKPPTQSLKEEGLYAIPPKEEHLSQTVSNPPYDHKPLECRGDSTKTNELKRMCSLQRRKYIVFTSFPESEQPQLLEDEHSKRKYLPAADCQRISTASSSSTSSCDSLSLSSSSPEPLREVALIQDEACRKLLDLQDSVCTAVPKLMEFVSSHWRCKEHLEKHLNEIKQAANGIACSVTCFLNFALDIKGNARRLTDTNLQTRLCKQLLIVEDSSVILQQTVNGLNIDGWPLNMLCQDPGEVQTPDQLERFVMVARTIPEDIKRLVSIINANGKLLFRVSQKDPDCVNTIGPPETKRSPVKAEQIEDLTKDDNDYVELQSKEEERKQREVQEKPKESVKPVTSTVQPDSLHTSSDSGIEESRPSSTSEHCKLYFGALQKAIRGFVESLQHRQPPEKFISQSKLVIMVGQKLVDTLCKKAQCEKSNQSLLCKSSHLCALLKQLAVATKKAAVHFPEEQALLEAQEFAKELAQRVQQFRISVDL
ncbi:cas scaffolding protein family member 4 [Pholidichthys leucotaenia]